MKCYCGQNEPLRKLSKNLKTPFTYFHTSHIYTKLPEPEIMRYFN